MMQQAASGRPGSVIDKIGKYEVVRKLGEGATSTVYLGRDPFASREVAIKLVSREAFKDAPNGHVMHRLFLNEASLAGKLVHPHIAEIYDAVADEDNAYIVMEYVSGGTLQRFARPDNLLELGDVIEIVYKCARALDFASQIGVIHRDIKPANILITDDNDIKITDFGSAAMLLTERTIVDGIGTPAYMSPEQHLNKPLNHQTDIYALGVVMFQLLTGRLPFQAGNIAGLAHHRNFGPTSRVRSTWWYGAPSSAIRRFVTWRGISSPTILPPSPRERRLPSVVCWRRRSSMRCVRFRFSACSRTSSCGKCCVSENGRPLPKARP
jgi:serine/threonine protein kinase